MRIILLSEVVLIPRHQLIVVFVVALVIRLLYLAFNMSNPDNMLVEDSIIYLDGARVLLDTGAFMRETTAGLMMETERMPLYMYLLAVVGAIDAQSAYLAIAVQAVVDACTCMLIGMLAATVRAELGLITGLLAACWPNLVIHSGQILTDSLFLFWLCACIWTFQQQMRKPGWWPALATGLLLGAAIMTRPTAQFAPPVIALVIFVSVGVRQHDWLRATAHALLMLCATLLVVSPILVRNATHFDTWALTSQSGTHLLGWVAPAITAHARGTAISTQYEELYPRAAARIEARERDTGPLNAFEHSRILSDVAVDNIREAPWTSIAFVWSLGTLRTLGTPALLHDQRVRRLSNASFAASSGSFAQRVWGYLQRNTPAYRSVAILAFVTALLACLMQAVGICLWLRIAPVQAGFAIALAVYFLALNGPVGDAKYRLPLEPVLICATALPVYWALHARRQRRRRADVT